ncbi:MAG: pyridoxamine 5'-phosphate oxidase family protein [Nitrososphaerota archaeon]|nr:pyridoxamine 5'-phosphate oxidase family protein [Nitrososphaerota archaeon]
MIFPNSELRYLRSFRVAHLATVDYKGNPHLVPIVFAADRKAIYFVVDYKTKKGRTLRRLKNIRDTRKATVLVDRYSEEWSKLSYMMISCKPVILDEGKSLGEKKRAALLLRKKYVQYRRDGYFPLGLDRAIFVKLLPQKTLTWKNLHLSVV